MLGVDIIEISRIHHAIETFGDAFLGKIFTKSERDYCESSTKKFERYAVRFAAKEAVAKVIKQGPRPFWQDIEIINDQNGAPIVVLSERLKNIFPHTIETSLSHCKDYAVAVAMVRQ